MTDKIPVNVFKYLLEKVPPYMGLLMLKTDNKGYILECIGNVEHYVNTKVETGDFIENIITPLTGILPLKSETFHIKKIYIDKDTIADIHIVKDNNSYWIILIDQTTEVDTLRSLIQDMNERELKKKQNQETNYFANYFILDFAVFKKTDKGFVLIPGIPDWIKKHILFNKENNTINLLEAFPFLEIFVLEAEDFWNKKTDGYYVSDLWSEQIGNSIFHLRAFAVNYKNVNYLFVKSFNQEGKNEQKLVQAYRDSSLAFDKLAKTEKKLKELLEYKNKFNSIISHDLRSPIASTINVMDIILNDKKQLEKLDDFYVELLEDVKHEMSRLLEYNDRLYHWSNLELGNFKLDIKDVSLEHILKSAYKTALIACEKKGINLHFNIESDAIIKVDEVLILQVLNNLLSNAIKFTPEGKDIFIKGYTKDKGVVIEIKDTGVGMPKELKENLFNKTNITSTLGTSGEKGTGLGLDIVKKILSAHNFNINVESENDNGTSFLIHIPESSVSKTK